MKKHTLVFAVLVVSSINLFSCQKEDIDTLPTVQTTKAMISSLSILNGTDWKFVNYSKAKFDTKFEKLATISFSDLNANTVSYSGTSFINHYFGSFRIDESKGLLLEKSPMGTTLMAGEEALMKLEYEFTKNLDKTTSFELQGNKLIFYLGTKGKADTETMTFVKA